MDQQIPLPLILDPELSFDRFVSGPNEEAVAFLRLCANGKGPRQIFIHGNKGLGKSHLIQATAIECARAQRSVIVLDFSEYERFEPEVLEGLDQLDLVCLDHVDAISGISEWEEALFAFYHEMAEQDGALVVTSSMAPEVLPFSLPDLRSRMQSGLIFKLHPLNEDQMLLALKEKAGSMGVELPLSSARYLMRHERRELSTLINILERLERSSLAKQRKLTIPFIKQALMQIDRALNPED